MVRLWKVIKNGTDLTVDRFDTTGRELASMINEDFAASSDGRDMYFYAEITSLGTGEVCPFLKSATEEFEVVNGLNGIKNFHLQLLALDEGIAARNRIIDQRALASYDLSYSSFGFQDAIRLLHYDNRTGWSTGWVFHYENGMSNPVVIRGKKQPGEKNLTFEEVNTLAVNSMKQRR